MSSMRKTALIGAVIVAPLLVALATWFGFATFEACKDARFINGFEAIINRKAPMTVAEVEAVMGKPASIEQSQTEDQTISGMVYHYPGHGADLKIVFINGVLFHEEMPAPTKS